MTSTVGIALPIRAVSPLHGVGGLERYADDLIRHLLKSGVRIDLVTQYPTNGSTTEVRDWLSRDGLTAHFVSYRTFPFAGRRGTTVLDRSTAYPLFGWRAGQVVSRLVRRGRVSLVHGNGASVLGYARARLRDRIGTVPLIFNPQGLEEFGATGRTPSRLKQWGYWPLQRSVIACAKAADRVIATDRILRQPIRDHLEVDESTVRVLPNGVDLERIDTLQCDDNHAIRERRGVGRSSVILSVGRLEENKGFHILAASLARVALARPNLEWRWVVVGDGPFGPQLRRLVQKLGLMNHVSFAGSVDDSELHAWYKTATVFAHPTLYEGSSLVTLEAMAHGCAVVATRAGGLPDKVLPGVTGWLVEPGDVSGLANAVMRAFSNLPKLPDMGRAGRQLVEREFSWDVIAGRWIGLYEDVLVYG